MKKARACLPEHLLGRNLLRGREAVPQDVAEVEPARRAHEDLEHVHLGGAGHGLLRSQPSWDHVSFPPRNRGHHECRARKPTGTNPCVPSTRVRRFLLVFLTRSPWGRPLREMLYSRHTRERHTAGRGETRGAEAPEPQVDGTPQDTPLPGHTSRGPVGR